jgi:hypothetical protein
VVAVREIPLLYMKVVAMHGMGMYSTALSSASCRNRLSGQYFRLSTKNWAENHRPPGEMASRLTTTKYDPQGSNSHIRRLQVRDLRWSLHFAEHEKKSSK